jgi:hypothetical protein
MAGEPITFDYNAFVGMYPEFAAITPQMAANYFLMSNQYFANSPDNPALAVGIEHMTMLAYMCTAHIAFLLAPRDANGRPAAVGQPASPIVGRVNSASQGSVSIGAELQGSGSPSEAFFTQTQYGFMFWQATAQYRTWRYAANPTYVPSAIFPMGRGRMF